MEANCAYVREKYIYITGIQENIYIYIYIYIYIHIFS